MLFLLKKYLWLIITSAMVLAFIFPASGMIFKPYLSYLLTTLMFISCLGITGKELITGIKNWKENLQILGIIHLISPIIIFIFIKPFINDSLFLGLILASTISSGMSVVFFSNLYGGESGKALVITSISTILSPLLVPILIYLFAGTSIKMDIIAISLTILKLVIIPLILAVFVRKMKIDKYIAKTESYLSIFLLFIIISGTIAAVKEEILKDINQSLILAGIVTGLSIINATIGWLIGNTRKEKIAYLITSSYKNFTLSTVLALSLFNPLIALPSIIYALVNNLMLIPFQLFFLKKTKKPSTTRA